MDNEGAALTNRRVSGTVQDLLDSLSTRELLQYLANRVDGQSVDDGKISMPSHGISKEEFDRHQQSVQHGLEQQYQCSNTILGNVQELSSSVAQVAHASVGIRADVQATQQDVAATSLDLQRGQWNFKALEDSVEKNMSKTHAELKTLREEIRTLRNYMRACQDDSSPRFPQFRRFPPEIRSMIWDFAIPGKILEIRELKCPAGQEDDAIVEAEYEFVPRRPPPSIAQVCQESRAVACRSGRLVSLNNLRPETDASGNTSSWWEDKQWTWFDPSRDTLYLNLRCHRLGHNFAFSGLLDCARHVAVGNSLHERSLYSLLDQDICPHLESIDIVGAVLVQPELSNPELEIALFGGERHLAIPMVTGDIDDAQAALEKLSLKMTQTYPSLDVGLIKDFFDTPSDTLLLVERGSMISWEQFPNYMKKIWARKHGRTQVVLDSVRRLRRMVDSSAIRRVWWLTRGSRDATGSMSWMPTMSWRES
ncbi:hypothetical protein F4779DRAFT_497816 [Xylariaceae sp. FL0662B]|nr:hypothetical protein F4779DRAFT_497816 [Xylariaceae sp. FL0662B]